MARTSRRQKEVIEQIKVPAIKIALYIRLSKEDNGSKSTDGIENQLKLLLDFIRKNTSDRKVEFVEIYIDHNRTGTNFERPEWERMMEDAKKNKINCIIVKDLSRFARNYLEAGNYLEKIFPFLGIRFIAINDHFDSAGEIFSKKEFDIEFKNLANEFYSKDISKKIMSVFQTKKEQGQFIGNKAPYGYILKNNHYIIDEFAASVVRRIFKMKIEGVSAYRIASILNQEKIPSPSRYAKEQGIKKYKDCNDSLWQQGTVSQILYNRAYVGDLVQGKYNHSIYSKEKQGKRKEAAWIVIEDTHPAIVNREIFQIVQKIREKNQKVWKNKQDKSGYKNVLEGILVCGICHHMMRRRKDIKKGTVKYYFFCGSAYSHSQVKCNTASVVDYKIFDIVWKQIQQQIDFSVERNNLLERIKKSENDSVVHGMERKRKKQIQDELHRYVYLKTSIYKDMKQGIRTKEDFLHTKEKYTQKILELKTKLNEKEQDDFDRNKENWWLNILLEFRNTKELTREIAVRFLEKVELYQDKRIYIKFQFQNECEIKQGTERKENDNREVFSEIFKDFYSR